MVGGRRSYFLARSKVMGPSQGALRQQNRGRSRTYSFSCTHLAIVCRRAHPSNHNFKCCPWLVPWQNKLGIAIFGRVVGRHKDPRIYLPPSCRRPVGPSTIYSSNIFINIIFSYCVRAYILYVLATHRNHGSILRFCLSPYESHLNIHYD